MTPVPGPRRRSRVPVAAALAAVLLLGFPGTAGPHDIPADVTVRALAKPEGGTLRLLVRVPLSATRDVRFPVRGAGYLDLERLGSELETAARMWIADYLHVLEGERSLGRGRISAVRVSLPSDGSFRAGWEEALAHVTGPGLEPGTDLPPDQASLDVLIEYSVRSADSRFSIEPRLAHLGMRTETHLRWVGPDGEVRSFHYEGNPGRIRLDPSWGRTVVRFVGTGFTRLAGGVEQLVLLLCLVLPFRRPREGAPLALSFVVGAGLGLAASSTGLPPDALWYPPLVATLVAATILYASVENVIGARLRSRWPAALAFGAVHGAALYLPLREQLQFAGAHDAWAVGAYGIGAAAAAVAALLAAGLLLEGLFRRDIPVRIGVIVISALAAHEAWHWLLDRGGRLVEYSFRIPEPGLRLAADLAGGLLVLLVLLGAAWGLRELFERWGLPP